MEHVSSQLYLAPAANQYDTEPLILTKHVHIHVAFNIKQIIDIKEDNWFCWRGN
jgi:hypothetical protein